MKHPLGDDCKFGHNSPCESGSVPDGCMCGVVEAQSSA